MSDNPRRPADAQLDPAQLAAGDSWARSCRLCTLVAQGGLAGLRAHMGTVHPGEPLDAHLPLPGAGQ